MKLMKTSKMRYEEGLSDVCPECEEEKIKTRNASGEN